jgi:peptidoglycan/xylan/chitin deacetylase (PgdA/CDA1 family)
LPQVLMYHSISQPPAGKYTALECTSPERFRTQMLYLKRRKLRGVSMRDLRRAMSAGNARGLIGLTFDDGYEDFLHVAVPILEGLGFSATLFVVGGMLGKENSWEHRGGSRPRLKLLGAEGVREVSERGMEIGAHTMSHPHLSSLDAVALEAEISESRRVVGEMVGTPVEGFCYPYGDLDVRAVQAARRSGYAYACAIKKQVEHSVYDWPRVYVGDRDFPLKLETKLRVRSAMAAGKRFGQLLGKS